MQSLNIKDIKVKFAEAVLTSDEFAYHTRAEAFEPLIKNEYADEKNLIKQQPAELDMFEITDQPPAMFEDVKLELLTEEIYIKDECDARYSSLKDSILNKDHIKDGQLDCKQCNRNFSLPRHLKVHMKSHSERKRFECNICNKKFTRDDRLKVHIKTHTVETPVECKICNKKYSRARHLKIHMNVHSEEKPFECIVCNKKFHSAYHFKMHCTSHSREKAFECRVCKRKFGQIGHLKVHIKQHFGAEVASNIM